MHALSPLLFLHVTAALIAVALGPFAFWARLGFKQRPRVHRAFGYAWVSMMLLASTSAVFIKGTSAIPRFMGYSPIHLLILVVYLGLFSAFWFLTKGDIKKHKAIMINIYLWACIVTMIFTLLPGRLMNSLLFNSVVIG